MNGRTLRDAVERARGLLAAAGLASPDADARWLVAHAAGIDPRREPQAGLTADVDAHLDGLLRRRADGEPLQLILGTAAFRTIELGCRPGVFIPRPETEVLAGLAVDALAAAVRTGRPSPVLLEPCCGTGAVTLSVAAEVAGAALVAADIDASAVALATANRDALRVTGGLRSPVTVVHGDLLDAFDPSLAGQVAVLVANPPYLPLADAPTLPVDVGAHDPARALFGGPDGHEVVDRLVRSAMDWLAPGGTLLLELDARRSAQTCDLARQAGLVDVRSHRDLTGAERFLVAHRPDRDGRAGSLAPDRSDGGGRTSSPAEPSAVVAPEAPTAGPESS